MGADDMRRLLAFERGFHPEGSPIDVMRRELMQYIQDNDNRLSLPCDGNCFNHQDLTVICCHQQIVVGDNNDNEETGSSENNPSSGPEGTNRP